MMLFQGGAQHGRYIAFHTKQHVLGIIRWPFSGCPADYMGVVAHPGVVVGAGVAHDARHVVSAAPGGVLNIWRVDTTV